MPPALPARDSPLSCPPPARSSTIILNPISTSCSHISLRCSSDLLSVGSGMAVASVSPPKVVGAMGCNTRLFKAV